MYTQAQSLSNIFSGSLVYGIENSESVQPDTQPLAAADQAPKFSFFIHQGIWQELPAQASKAGIINLDDLVLNRPLVISFYSPHTKAYGHQQLETLISLYPKIRALGGELLVLTGESIEQIYRISSYYYLPFNIAQDTGNAIASKFKLYSLTNPLWQQLSGIEEEIALPATYVIAHNRQIAYDFVDADFTKNLPERNLLAAVYNVSHKQIKKVA